MIKDQKNVIGNVIRILDNKKLVISIGFNDGLQLNDKIIIYEIGEDIKGIDGNIIGTLDYIKATLTVTNIYDTIAVCQYPKTTISTFEKSISSISKSFIAYENQQTLNVNENEIEPYTKTHSDTIHIGDYAKKILTNMS